MTREEATKICQSIKFILENSDYTEVVEEALDMAIEALEQEPKTGKWIRTDMTDIVYGERIDWVKWNCSECGIEKKIGWAKGVNFCPNCGARMESEEE